MNVQHECTTGSQWRLNRPPLLRPSSGLFYNSFRLFRLTLFLSENRSFAELAAVRNYARFSITKYSSSDFPQPFLKGEKMIRWRGLSHLTFFIFLSASLAACGLFDNGGGSNAGEAPPAELPDTHITSNPANPSASASASFTFISTVAGATFECSIDAGAVAACTSPKDYTGLADGTHTFNVRSSDSAGNTDPTPASFTWVIDTTIANLSAIAVTPRDAAVAQGGARQFIATGTYSDNSTKDITSQVNWGSSNMSVATVSAGGSVAGLAVGTTTITATLGGVSGQTTLTVSATALPRTGQVACYSETGANRECSGTGEDGERQAGVAWPVPRFVLLVDPASNGNCVADQLTGLEWVRVPDTTLWNWTGNPSVFTYATAFDLCGANDWRLPNRRELRSLIHYGQINTAAWLNDPAQGFSNIQGGTTSIYWTSTTDASDSASAWSVYMGNGVTVGKDKGISYYVWLVRTPAIPAPAAPARTGQTISYATEDDGALQAGVVWPDPRFT
ncbi:MAG: DUF1566 domain-containing protein, partial [Nitrospirae bacterium]|nr:DUF1566 domain-containing protein [Nitrospirota bacterium]